VTGVTVNEMAMIFPFSAESGLDLGFTQLPTQRAVGTLLLGLRYSENEADDSPPNAEVNITRVVHKIRVPMIFHNEKHVYWH
jgi:hypothetical protein